MLSVLYNIIFEYADVKKDEDKFLNCCNQCGTYKHQKMMNIDIRFYQIKLSFILEHVFSTSSLIKPAFQRIIERSEIQTTRFDHTRYGWITNSIDIDNYWFSLRHINRRNYIEFVNNNFDFIEERNINFCNNCWSNKDKDRLMWNYL